MSIEQAERLKHELTDKYVIVARGVPELRRFAGLTGTVKTVNMNGKALVQFDGPADITWYDIDPAYLEVVEAPLPKQAPAAHAPSAGEAKEKAKPAPAKKPAGKSPLELARQQGAAGAAQPAAGKKPSPLELARQQGAAGAPQAEGAKKPSPLELARQQGGAKAEQPAAEKPKAAQPAAGKKLSPLELARQQGAAGGKKSPPAGESPAEAIEESVAEQSPPAPTAASAAPPKPQPPGTGASGKKLSPLELARQQGAAKR
ncbi:MAG: hypothetical protein WD069_19055 [Planctomycetales bacterium]